jgi:hypothetical protein
MGFRHTTQGYAGPGRTGPLRYYPGSSSAKDSQPPRGCDHFVFIRTRDGGHNPVGVVSNSKKIPKVGAGAPTLGWRAQPLWDCRNMEFFFFTPARIDRIPPVWVSALLNLAGTSAIFPLL